MEEMPHKIIKIVKIMKKVLLKYFISALILFIFYILALKCLNPDPHVNNFIPIFILRLSFLIIGIILSVNSLRRKKIFGKLLFRLSLLINLTSIIEVIFTSSNNIYFYVIMFFSILISFTQIYIVYKVEIKGG